MGHEGDERRGWALVRRGWTLVRRPLVQRAAVGLSVLLAAGVLSVALVDDPGTDRVTTEDDGARPGTDRDEAGQADARTGTTGGSLSGRAGGGSGDRIRSSEGRRGSSGPRERGSRTRDKGDDRDRGSGGRGGAGVPTTTTTVGGPAVPGALVLDPAGTLPALAPVHVAPARPCPAGTTGVEVRVTATGGPQDGEVLVVEAVAPAADGGWSVPALVVPAVAEVDVDGWAAIAPSATVSASCDGGPAYEPTTVTLGAVEGTPTFDVTWDGTTAAATATACPTHARLEVFVGSEAPELDGEQEATATQAMTVDDAEPGSWSGSLEPTYSPGSDGVWASVACLDGVDGRPVWRHALVELVAP